LLSFRYIHSKQLVHLDIKPENIFISLDYTPSNSPGVGGDGLCDDATNTGATTSSDLSFGPSSASSTPIAAKSAGLKRTLACDAASNSCPETNNKTSKLSSPSVVASAAVVEAATHNGNDSTDSGNHSGHECRSLCLAVAGEKADGGGGLLLAAAGAAGDAGSLERISYKIGDLGHVAPVYGDYIPEEGDCRYMAPELLLHEVDKERLPKADIFSLGLTLYECATLTDLPKNSMEDPIYERLKAGDLPLMPGYSKEFNQLIQVTFLPIAITVDD
jgi:serine/threonine protein kinase